MPARRHYCEGMIRRAARLTSCSFASVVAGDPARFIHIDVGEIGGSAASSREDRQRDPSWCIPCWRHQFPPPDGLPDRTRITLRVPVAGVTPLINDIGHASWVHFMVVRLESAASWTAGLPATYPMALLERVEDQTAVTAEADGILSVTVRPRR